MVVLARSPLWVQMLADVFGKEVYLSESHHSAAWGAAWTALVAIGKVAIHLKRLNKIFQLKQLLNQIQHNHEIYAEAFKKYENDC